MAIDQPDLMELKVQDGQMQYALCYYGTVWMTEKYQYSQYNFKPYDQTL